MRFTDGFRQIFKDIENLTANRPIKAGNGSGLLERQAMNKRRRQFVDTLAATYPNSSTRESDEQENAKQIQLIDFLIEVYDANDDTFRGYVEQTFDLCCRLSALAGKSRIAKTQLEMAFIANVFAIMYLIDSNIQSQVIQRVEDARAKKEWFVIPRVDAKAEYPKWLDMPKPPTCVSFQSYLFKWRTIASLSIPKMKKLSIEQDDLLNKLVKDGEMYMLFLAGAINQCYTSVTKNEDWKLLIPHYDRLVYIGLQLLYQCSYETWAMPASSTTTEYFAFTPRGVKTTMRKAAFLMLNPKLTQPVILALLEATNINHERSVGHCLNQLEEWFVRLVSLKVDLTNTIKGMDSEFSWIVAIKLLLRADHMDVLKKSLLFIYNIIPILPEIIRVMLMRVFLTQHFELFLHWHHEVRRFYHHILVYRLFSNLHRVFLISTTDSLLAKVDGEHELSGLEYEGMSSRQADLIDEERAKWIYFDVLTLSLCMQERHRAHQANKEQREACALQEARVTTLKRDLHMCSQSRASASFSRECMSSNVTTDVDEKMQMEMETLAKLKSSLPYLRVTSHDYEFDQFIAGTIGTGQAHQRYFAPKEGLEWKHVVKYTRPSLLEYTKVLESYYNQCPRHPSSGRIDTTYLPIAPELTF